MKRVNISVKRRKLSIDSRAAIGLGSLIIFIAMILVAGIAASVFIQTMNSLEQQALQTGQDVIRDISSGLPCKVNFSMPYVPLFIQLF